MVIRRKFQQTNGGNLVEMISQGEYNKGVMQGRFKTSFATLLVFTFIFSAFLGASPLAEAARINPSPSSGTYSVGQTITVRILVNTEAKAVNTAEATIQYSTNTL